MGLWWQETDDANKQNAVRLAGDPTAMSKSIPILWRSFQDWHCLEVIGKFENGYNFYFSTGQTTMVYRKDLKSRFVMVREGKEPVEFWVYSIFGTLYPLELRETGRILPATRARINRSAYGADSFDYIRAISDDKIAWV